MKVRGLASMALLMLAVGCSSSPIAPDLPAGAIQVNGTVRHFALEGGFWAVRGDDGVTYDPMNGLASEFQRENLRVIMVAKVRDDLGGIHMVGPIVEVLSITRR
jgi:hypothetical protein